MIRRKSTGISICKFPCSCLKINEIFSLILISVNVEELSACCDTDEQCTLAEVEILHMAHVWSFYGVNSEVTKNKLISLHTFKLADIRLFIRAWDLTIEEIAMSDFTGPFNGFDSIVEDILSPVLEKLRGFLKSLLDQKTETTLIDIFFSDSKTDADKNDASSGAVIAHAPIAMNLTDDLHVLFNFFELLQKLSGRKRVALVNNISTNCQCYLKVKSLAKSYKNIMLVKRNLKLAGDFSIIERLDEIV